MPFLKRVLLSLALVSGAATVAHAQSTAQPVLPGMLVTTGCPPGYTSCYVPYSNTNPLPVTGGTSTANQGTPNAGGTAAWWTRLTDNLGNAITSTLNGSKQSLDVNQTSATPAGSAIIGKVGIDQTTPGTTNGVQTLTGSTTAVTQATASNLNDTAAQGAPNTAANAWPIKNTDGTNVAAVKAASTAPVATDPALVVGLSPNGNQATAANQPTNAAQGSTTSGQTGTLMQGAVTNSVSGMTYTNGQTNPVAIGTKGQVLTTYAVSGGSTQISGSSGAACILDASNTCRAPNMTPLLYDGTNLNIGIGCTNSAVVSVPSGTTVQIVALTAGKQIRVCSFGLSISLAGTAQFEYGTGTLCATGTTALTGAMNMTAGVPFTMTMAEGQLFASASANALCIAAVTGNVNGFISYAVY